MAREKASEPAREKMLATIDAVEEIMLNYILDEEQLAQRKIEEGDTDEDGELQIIADAAVAMAGWDINGDGAIDVNEMMEYLKTETASDAPDLAKAASAHPLLTHGETGEIDISQLQLAMQSSPEDDEPDWYKLARTTTFDFSNQQFRQIPIFLQLAFSSDDRYQSEKLVLPSPQFANQIFIYWRTTVRQPQLRTFEDARADIQDDWVTIEAAKMMEDKTGKLAEVAEEDGTLSLGDSLKDKKYCNVEQLFETLPFSFLSSGMTPLGGNQGGLGTITRIENGDPVKDVTADFMKKIFQLQPGETTAVMDSRRQTAYVVRLIADISQEDLRRESFAIDSQQGLDNRLIQLGRQDRMTMFNDWLTQFLDDLDVDWKVNPDAN